MRSITNRPPRLGFPLFFSTVLSTAVVVLHFVASPPFVSIPPIIHAVFAVHNAYYLVRCVQRCAAIKRGALVGADMWPVVQLFPDGTDYFASARNGLLCTFSAFGVLPKKVEDNASVALSIAYWLGLVVNAVVYMEARRVREAEDNILCAKAHKMHCQRCGIDRAAPVKPQAPLPTDLHLGAVRALPLSMALSLVLCGLLFALVPVRSSTTWLSIMSAALITMHRLFFIVRARLTRPVNWPSTRLFPGKKTRTAFQYGNVGTLVGLYLTICLTFYDPCFACSTVPFARVVLIVMELLAVVVNVFAYICGRLMLATEADAACMRDGHCRKCVRRCSVPQDTGASAAEAGHAIDSKITVETSKECSSALST